uniref:transcription factor TFIIIB component B'' homolog isoform X2 n=1 Tax=Scatophagus argus TaxID=75038 RepID=UPI001ED821FE|nr:transcription factor TFIIIB component B'' homolog isoform X2 [Scatophagus argus]
MFRRSRFSIRPNVGTAGRTTATSQESPPVNQETSETPRVVSESCTAPAVTDNKSVVTPSEKSAAPGDGNDQNGEGTSSSAAVQRRKRFSVKPKVAPGRPSTFSRTLKSPVKAVSETPVEVPGSEKPTTTSQAAITSPPQALQSPRRRRPSEESKPSKVQPKPTLIPSDGSGPSAFPLPEDLPKNADLPADSGKQVAITSGSQVKDVPSRLPDKVPPSLPDKESIEISEKARTLVSSKGGLSPSPAALSLSRLLNDPSDLQRLAKARKLRELLRHEMHKEKKIKKAKARAKEFTIDPAKMTMRDLIRYLPVSNPMTSSIEDPASENETVVPPSPGREESPERAQEPEVAAKIASPRVEEEEEEAAEEEEEEALMVPQVKVAEDGSLIIDEESLTVEVQRAKGPNPAQDRDPIFERGSTTTYSSFRKGTYSKPWSSEETDMFFLAISMVGTDFSMICQLFPHRARSEIKNKFKKEERENAWRIDKAFRERRKLDIEYFSKLLEKILEVQKSRKKLKSLAEKNSRNKPKRKAKGKKAAPKLSDVEEEDEEVENEMPDLEEEGEKENEDLCSEEGTPVSRPKKNRKRKNRQDVSTVEPNDKKNKSSGKSNEPDEACIPEDAEAALPEDHPVSEMSEKTDKVNAAKDTVIKPAKLSRGRAPKPLLPLGRKWGKKPAPPSTRDKDTVSDEGDVSVSDGASEEQVNKDASPVKQVSKKSDGVSSEDEDATVQPPRPTRYGRTPKPTKPLTYPAKDDAHSSKSETTPASPVGTTASTTKPKPKCTAKRGRSSKSQSVQESKKTKLVTLRASQSEYSDEENEKQWGDEEVEEEQHRACSFSKDGIAPAFVPASLRSPPPVISEVEETMEELEILAHMPDVLGISQDALCPDVSCELAQNETGTAEPCEHQLDLLVDVIDFLSSENTEVSEEQSYNEAAQTLLAIGSLAHVSQSAQNQTATQDLKTDVPLCLIAGTASVSVGETSQHQEEDIASKPAAHSKNSLTPLVSATSGQGVTEASETVATVELQNSTADNGNMPITESSDQRTGSDMNLTPQLHSSPEGSKKISSQPRGGRLSKVKPKPNLIQASRTAQSKFQLENMEDSSQKESMDEISRIEEKLAEDASGNQESSVGQVISEAATSDLNTSKNQSQSFSDPTFEPSFEHATGDSTTESTDKILVSHVGTTHSSFDNLVICDTAVTDLQGTNIYSAPVQQSSSLPDPYVTPVEDLPVSQKEESEDAATWQIKKSRFKKVKPKPNLSQTSRTLQFKSDTTKDIIERNPNPTPNLKFHEKTVIDVEAEPTCITSHEKPSKSAGPTSDFKPSLDISSTITPREELSTTEEKNTDVGVVLQIEPAATSDQRALEKLNFSEAQFEPCREQSTRGVRPTSESTEEKLMSHNGSKDSSCNLLTSNLAVPELQVGQESNIDSVPVQESSNHPASHVAHVEELPLKQKEESVVVSSFQTKRGKKVKPKPKLSQTSRIVHSKPQNTKESVAHMQLAEKPSSPTSEPQSMDNTVAEPAEAEPTCITSPEKSSQSTGPVSDLTPSLDIGSTLEATGEQSTTEQKKTDVGVTGQIESDGTTSDQSSPHVTHVEELPLSQKEESVVASTFQTRRGQKVKPKPNLSQTSRTVRSKPQTTKNPVTHLQLVEKPSSPTSKPESADSTIAEPTRITSSEKTGQSTGPASGLIASFDVSSTLTPTEEKNRNVGDVDHVESGAATSDQRASENQSLSDALYEPNRDPATRDTRPTLESTEQVMSHDWTAESSCSNLCSTGSAVPESQVGPQSNIDSVPVSDISNHPAGHLMHAEKLLLSQKAESVVISTCRTRRGQKIKPKPNLPQTSRSVQPKPQTTKDPVAPMQLVEKPSTAHTIAEIETEPTGITSPEKTSQIKITGSASVSLPSLELCSTHEPAEELSTTGGQKTDFESAHKNLLTSTHCLLTTEPLSCKKLGPAESEKSIDGTSPDALVVATSSVAENQSVLPELFLESNIREKSTVEGESTGVEVEAGPASQWDCKTTESKSQPTDGPTAISDVQSSEHGSAESKIKSANTQSTPDPKEIIQEPCSENNFEAQSQVAVPQYPEPTETNQTAAQSGDNNESESTDSSKSSRKGPQTRRGRLVKPKPNLGRRGQHQQIQNTKPAEADSGTSSEAVDALVCEKPVSVVQPNVQEAVEGATGRNSPINDAESSLGCLTQVIEQVNQHDSPPNVAGSSLGCLTPDISTQSQDGSQSITGVTQSHPNVTIFTDMLQDQMPSDPDEPFFILSLTEIPVCSLAEVVNRTPEPVPYLPETDASVQQQSVPAEQLAAGDRPASVPESTEVGDETGFISVKDTGQDKAACVGSVKENPVDPHDSSPGQPSIVPGTVENNDETEHPPKKQRLMGTGRAAKLQVKPKFPRKNQASKTLAAKEAEFFSTQGSELPGPSVQPKAMDEVVSDPQKEGGDHVDVEKQVLTSGKEPEDSSSEAQTAQTRRTSSRNRKPEGFSSVLSETNNTANSSTSLSGKAAPKGPKVKSSQVARKQSTPSPVASTSYDVDPTPTPVQPSGETHSTSSTTSPTQAEMDVEQTSEHSRLSSDPTPCTVEVSVPHQIDSVESVPVEEEPTSVSQYFLSDIFTEVDDGGKP